MRTTCLLALLSLWLLALASAAPKKLEKKAIANSLAPKAIEPPEQKLEAPSPKISDEALMESPGETVDRAKKQASTTFCVEVRQNKPTYVDCNEAGGGDSKVIVVQGNEPSGQDGALPGPASPLLPGVGPHFIHLPHDPHGPHGPHHGLHYSGPGTSGSADGVPATLHYLIPGGDGGALPYPLPAAGGDPSGGMHGILYALPAALPGEFGPSGVGPNGVHVHVHPSAVFPSGSAVAGGPSPTGVHLHLPTGSGVPSSSPVHLSGIECLCAGTPAVDRDDEGNAALAIKFLQDLQKNDKMTDADSPKASSGDQSPSDQPSGSPTILLPKSTGMSFAAPMMIETVPMMKAAGGLPVMGPRPIVGGPMMMAGIPMPVVSGPMIAGLPIMRATGDSPTMGGMPVMPQASEDPKAPAQSIMIHVPTSKAEESPKTPTSPNGVHMTIMEMPAGKAGEDPKNPPAPNGVPLTIMNMPMGKAGENPAPPTSPNLVPITIMSMPMGKAAENPMSTTLTNGLPLPIMNLSGMKADGMNSHTAGKVDPAVLLRYYPMRPMQNPIQSTIYPHGPHMMNPMYPMSGGYLGPYAPHGFGHLHRSQYDCLQDSFQSVPAIQGLRFSRGPDESELPPAGQQSDAEAKSEAPAGSEHAEPARSDDKESRTSHFIADEHNDAANSV